LVCKTISQDLSRLLYIPEVKTGQKRIKKRYD